MNGDMQDVAGFSFLKVGELAVIILLLFISQGGESQDLSSIPDYQWPLAGLSDSIPVYDDSVYLADYNVDTTGQLPADDALKDAIAALPAAGTVIFPSGTIRFEEQLRLRDGLVLKGHGTGTLLQFDLNGRIQNAIEAQGQYTREELFITDAVSRGDSFVVLDQVWEPTSDWVHLQFDDADLMASSWAEGTAGGLYRIQQVESDTVFFSEPLRISIPATGEARLRPIVPLRGVGLQCFSIERMDSTVGQSSTIHFQAVVESWIIGVESIRSNFAHVDLRNCAHILVRGGDFHHAHAYGGGGQGYGVVLQSGSHHCLVENNVFERLRHAVLLQSGAHANVVAYNFATDPFWTDVSLPSDAAGELVAHGNYPYGNLFEGNLVQNIVVDASHGLNGPHNTFFRNRADGYGMFMSPGSGTDSTHVLGNEITNTSFARGLYILLGNGNITHGNWVRGQWRPSGTAPVTLLSLYRSETPGYWADDQWPVIGQGALQLSQYLPAKERYAEGETTDCRLSPRTIVSSVAALPVSGEPVTLFPNPVRNQLIVDYPGRWSADYQIWNIFGQVVKEGRLPPGQSVLNVAPLPPGSYFFLLEGSVRKFQKW